MFVLNATIRSVRVPELFGGDLWVGVGMGTTDCTDFHGEEERRG